MRFLKLIQGSARDMSLIPAGTVHLAFTSPPYGSLIDYNRQNPEQIGNYRDDDYFKLVREVYKQIFRVLAPGRRFVLNIPNVPAKGEFGIDWHMYGDLSVQIVRPLGFELAEVVIWRKGLNRFSEGKGGTLPYPSSPVLFNNWEYVYIFRKKGTPDYDYASKEVREASKLSKAFISEVLTTVWDIKPETRSLGHPAPFPEELARRIIKLYSFVGDRVLEPFGGSGTTARIALEEKRSCYIFEIEPSYIPIIKERVNWGRQWLDEKISYMHVDQSTQQTLENIDVAPDEEARRPKKYDKYDEERDKKYERKETSLHGFS